METGLLGGDRVWYGDRGVGWRQGCGVETGVGWKQGCRVVTGVWSGDRDVG